MISSRRWTSLIMSVVSVFLLLSPPTVSKRYCRDDKECLDLGELYCIKSHCDYGVCGCPRGKAARYLGSKNMYKCVTIKKIDERCSNDGDAGVCGAANARCNENTHRCECTSGMVPMWGGEHCAPENTRVAGETCSGDGGLGTCVDGTVCSSAQAGAHWHSPVTMNVPTCACSNRQELFVANWYSNPYKGEETTFPSMKEPACIPRKIGDKCWRTSDCPSDSICSNNKLCICDEVNLVPDYNGEKCIKPLTFGMKCVKPENLPSGSSPSEFGCDGSLGLVCGDSCALTDADNYPGTNNATCTCGPFHSKSGDKCIKNVDGSPCYGDYNCKGWSLTAICEDGKCQAGSIVLVYSIITFILPISSAIWTL